jgi:O-antigen ligase
MTAIKAATLTGTEFRGTGLQSASKSRRPYPGPLVLVAVVVLPATALLFTGRPEQGAWYYFGVLGAVLAFSLLRGRLGAYTIVLMGTFPVLAVLRGFFYYNAPQVLLALGVGLWIIGRKDHAETLLNYRSLIALLSAGVGYWLLSYAVSGHYWMNLRALELVFSALMIVFLSSDRRALATVLLGVGLSSIAVALAFMTHGERLGATFVGGVMLGNPVTVGLPLALVFVLTIADDGRWLMLDNRPRLRIALRLISFSLLVLSTSRGSWLVAVACLGTMIVLGRQSQKARIIGFTLIAALMFTLLLKTEQGAFIERWYGRMASASSRDEALRVATTGRAAQWQVFTKMLSDSPILGYGPGLGNTAFREYARKDPRIAANRTGSVLHSLYLQVGADFGLVGLFLLSAVIIPVVIRAHRYWRACGEVVPILGIVGFLTVGISVTGFDGSSGMFLGLSLVGTVAWGFGRRSTHTRSRPSQKAGNSGPTVRRLRERTAAR